MDRADRWLTAVVPVWFSPAIDPVRIRTWQGRLARPGDPGSGRTHVFVDEPAEDVNASYLAGLALRAG
jgi:hypothetical protein